MIFKKVGICSRRTLSFLFLKTVYAPSDGMRVGVNIEGPNDGGALTTVDKTASVLRAISAKSAIKTPLKLKQSWSFRLINPLETRLFCEFSVI